MKTAQEWGLTPSAFDALPDADQVEMVAYTAWRGSLCPNCLIAADLAMDPNTTFSVTDEVFYCCQIREAREAELRKAAGKNESANYGRKVWISNARPNRKAVNDG